MKKSIKLFLIIALTVLFACQKDIKLKPAQYDSQLSIECILIPGQIPQLFLQSSVPFFSPNTTPSQLFVRGASVSITGSFTDNLTTDSVFDKFRCRWIPFYKGAIPSQSGQTYHLSVTYDDKTYTASTTINQPKVSISTTSYVAEFHDVYGAHEGVIINFTDIAGSENFYRYQMSRAIDSSVYGSSSLGLIHSTCTNGALFYIREVSRSIYFDKGLDGQSMQLIVEPAYGHSQNDTAFVFVQSLDKNSAEFYDNLDKQKLAQYNPFIEPVFLKTKIAGCIGIFGSAVVSDSLLFVYPE